MRRALQLALNGEGRVSPNPMVGAIIVHNGRIIGEGFHAFYGGPHAEVNAVRSVKEEDRHLLKDSTIYVTLEPCAHFGKTPPCANLIVDCGIPEVMIGALDPNPLVAGKGVKILENAGVKVGSGILEKDCIDINRRFIKAQTSEYPWILLKWAQSADGFMAKLDNEGNPCPVKFSSPISSVWMHRQRATVDAILIGSNTQKIDNPKLNVRLWGGDSPKKIVVEGNQDLDILLKNLRKEGITSIMVEGGSKLLNSFINKGLYDEIRVETSPIVLSKGIKAPHLPDNITLIDSFLCGDNEIRTFRR